MKYILTLLASTLVVLAGNAFACYGFYTGERISGMNKICYYSHLGSNAAVTFASYSVCPMSYQFNH